jgi:low temperature requirement protein LtrA
VVDDEGTGGSTIPLLQPPRLRMAEHRTASRLELFFDLAYVLVLAEVVGTFGHDLTWSGAAVFAGLFTVTWWSWVTTTLYANRFDTNDVPYRVAKLGQTFAVVVMAAAAADAVGKDAPYFAAGYVATRGLLVALYLRAYRHVPQARRTLAFYLAGALVGALLWSVSIVVPAPARYALWGAGVLVEALAPLLATRFGDDIALHEEHLPDRFGLFALLVLGESITAVATGLRGAHWRAESFATAALGFLIAAALWWNYFDLGGAAGKQHLIEDDDSQSDDRHDKYVFGHLPLLIGMAAVGIGIEQFVLHPTGDLPPAGVWTLCGGSALFLTGVALVMAGTARRWSAAWPWPAAAIPFLLATGFLAFLGTPILTAAAVAAVLVGVLLAGLWQQHRGRIETAET